MISDYDLIKHKYDIPTLIDNIDHLNLKLILKTQILTPTFCMEYIYTPFESNSEDHILSIDYILQFQPHLLRDDLNTLIKHSIF
jgi:hypothetical protein